MVRSFELKQEARNIARKEKLVPSSEESKKTAGSTSNSAVDEIDQLEIGREGEGSGANKGPLSEQ